MKFRPTEYRFLNVRSGRMFEDKGWTLSDPEDSSPSLIRAVYANKKFTPREDLDGLYRYADWMPIQRILKNSCAPVTYKSKGLAKYFDLENLYITFSGYNPHIGAKMSTCSFKETEAFTVCARMSKKEDRVLVVQSAGNTARAFAQVCSDNEIPVVICIPEDCKHDLWFRKKLNKCVKLIAVPHGCDYYDAIRLGEKLAEDPHYFLEGGAKNVARRDGMGTTVLSFVDQVHRLPDAYFQAVGSGTGAIAAWENAERIAADGSYGENHMRVYVAQNKPFTILYDSWKAQSRELAELSPEEGRHQAEIILAKVLSNRKPPYSIVGGLYDVLKESNGDVFVCSNDEIMFWLLKFRNLEGYELLPASCAAVAALSQAVKTGAIRKDEYIMLNCTGGGMLASMSKGFYFKEPELILSDQLPADEIIDAVNALFKRD